MKRSLDGSGVQRSGVERFLDGSGVQGSGVKRFVGGFGVQGSGVKRFGVEEGLPRPKLFQVWVSRF